MTEEELRSLEQTLGHTNRERWQVVATALIGLAVAWWFP